jgi:hypothetical protein
MRRSQRWDESSPWSKVLIMVLTTVQVNGSKPRWAAIIAIDFVGPILYFTRGRRPSPS